MEYILSLGSNIGDKKKHLHRALSLLEQHNVSIIATSALYRTSPVDYLQQDDFLNMVALVDTPLTPTEMLTLIHAVEQQQGRQRTIKKGPRTLDIDIIAAEGVTMSEPALTIPHPRAKERRFVMEPIQDLFLRHTHSNLLKDTAEWRTSFSEHQTIEKVEEQAWLRN